MKFGNLENLRKNAKNLTKAVMFTAAGLGAGSVAGQDAKFQGELKTAKLYEPMRAAGAIDSTTTEIEFSKFTDAQMKEAVDKFKNATGRLSPEEFEAKKAKIMEENPNATSETIDRVKYKLNTKEVEETTQSSQKGASYAEWFAKQKDGEVVEWKVEEGGDGRVVKIDRDIRNKSLYSSKPIVKSSPAPRPTLENNDNEAMASTSEDYVFAEDHFKNQNKK